MMNTWKTSGANFQNMYIHICGEDPAKATDKVATLYIALGTLLTSINQTQQKDNEKLDDGSDKYNRMLVSGRDGYVWSSGYAQTNGLLQHSTVIAKLSLDGERWKEDQGDVAMVCFSTN